MTVGSALWVPEASSWLAGFHGKKLPMHDMVYCIVLLW
ncbi:predicted protein [Plenodomus lingam JN3]|uniref:Predicted protein n=1 Tax=Leptosphaeria maculans (strain JN3 / isolate v23.1.3 / race Av1-4-5-6-7-8) TaxID=985895 RepID=E5AFC3_LEPMJ|nr:predicted protein [Plenodomus lingam JN3]CBY01912.1 predicted protein [Plenodomus lingam JN3]